MRSQQLRFQLIIFATHRQSDLKIEVLVRVLLDGVPALLENNPPSSMSNSVRLGLS